MGRKDGRHLKELSGFHIFYTFVMPKRSQSFCWHEVQVDASNTLDFLNKKKQAGHDITLFQLVIAALLRATSQFPEINRFIYGHKFYARNECSVSFSINRRGKTVIRKASGNPEWTIFEVANLIKNITDECLAKPESSSGHIVDFLMKLPTFITSSYTNLYPWLVDKGILPWKHVKDNPLFVTTIVSDIGSFGLTGLFHHLYDWGTASSFVSMGALHKAPVVSPDGTLKVSDIIKFGFTIDERVCDGKKLADFVLYFKECVENPWVLESPPAKVVRE
jgi:hypothetical protein